MNYPIWIWLAAGIAVVVAIAGLILWRRARGRRGGIRHTLRAIAVDRIEDVLLPDGMGGEIHLEHVVLTAKGILVINVKQFTGVVFASDRMDEWAVMGDTGRSAFPNPQPSLYDRVASVKQLVRDVDVTGFVLFPETADFSKGRPKDVIQPSELGTNYKKPERAEIERHTEAFAQHWDMIKTAARPAASRPPRLD